MLSRVFIAAGAVLAFAALAAAQSFEADIDCGDEPALPLALSVE